MFTSIRGHHVSVATDIPSARKNTRDMLVAWLVRHLDVLFGAAHLRLPAPHWLVGKWVPESSLQGQPELAGKTCSDYFLRNVPLLIPPPPDLHWHFTCWHNRPLVLNIAQLGIVLLFLYRLAYPSTPKLMGRHKRFPGPCHCVL